MKAKEKLLLYKIQVNKDPDSYGQLYDLYIEKIYRFVFFKVSSKEEAEDLTSEIFLKTWNYLIGEKKKKIKSFSGLIYRVARNSIVDFYRQKSRTMECSLEEARELVDKSGRDDVKQFEVKEDLKNVLEKVDKMKETYREVFLLHYIDELSTKEISVILGKSKTNVRVILHRATKIINKLFEE